MLIYLDSSDLAQQVVFVSLTSVKASELKARTDTSGSPKLSPNGQPTFSTGLKVLTLSDGSPSFEVRNATLNVCQPLDLHFSATYKPSGKVWITHYLTSGKQLGVSITCEKVVPARSSSMPPMPAEPNK